MNSLLIIKVSSHFFFSSCECSSLCGPR